MRVKQKLIMKFRIYVYIKSEKNYEIGSELCLIFDISKKMLSFVLGSSHFYFY